MRRLILAAALAFCTAAFAVEATVVSVTGKVEKQEGRNWVALKKGDKVEKSAVISTGYNSSAVLEFKGTKFTLGALTRMTVEDLAAENDKDSSSLFIESGSVSADVNGADGKRVGFKVRSPIATASVRGTMFTFTADGALNVDRGVVALSPSSSTKEKGVVVSAGQQSKADAANGMCSDPAYEKAQAAKSADLTSTLMQEEAVATAPTAAKASSATAIFDSTSGTTTATLNITLDFN